MKTRKTISKRAFTLMELLIVVIVIGVLAAVTLPKFNRVIENRKVTEAEEMMSAVRTEQERRCSLDKNYTTNFDNLKDIIASNNTKNYTYSLQPQGISAQSNDAGYTLKILSYEDGSYCCEGEGCKKLNKNYPDCSTLSFPESVCIGEESGLDGLGQDPDGRECTDGEVQGSQICNGCGTQTTQLCVNGKWTDSLGTCSKTEEECKPKPVECPEPKPATSEECSPCKEIRTRSVTCGDDGQWIIGEWNAECKTQDQCPVGYDTCNDARDEGRLDSFCAQYGLFADSVYSMKAYHKKLTAENCCHACPDTCVVENGKCITPPWELVKDSDSSKVAVRYSSSAPTAFITSFEDSPDDIVQYGSTLNGGVCDFKIEKEVEVSVADLEAPLENLDGLCAYKCGSDTSCSATIYTKNGNWQNWLSGEIGGDTCCKLYAGMSINDLFSSNFYNTKNMVLDWKYFTDGRNSSKVTSFGSMPDPSLSSVASLHKFYADTDPSGNYSSNSKAWTSIHQRCNNRALSGCTSITGIPDAYKTSSSVTLYSNSAHWMDGQDIERAGAKLTVTTTKVDVSYVPITKYTCKRSEKAGNTCYPEGM